MLPLFLLWAVAAHAQLTVYKQSVLGAQTTSALAPGATYTGKAAYDPLILNGPTPPTNLNTQFNVQLQTTAGAQQGLSSRFPISAAEIRVILTTYYSPSSWHIFGIFH